MKKTVWIITCLGLATVFLFHFVIKDDPEVLVSTDITRYAVQPEDAEDSFNLLLDVFRKERPYEEFPLDLRRENNESDAYQDLLISNSEIILHNYSVAKEVLKELRPLDSFESIGDTTSSFGSETIKFLSVRDLVRATCFYTELSYIDKSMEPNLNELLALHAVMSKWLPNTRTIVHSMIAVVTLKHISETVLFMEPHLNPDEIQQVLDAYSKAPDYPQSIENAIYYEYCVAADYLRNLPPRGESGISHLLFKPNQTLNIYGTYLEEQIALSRDNDWSAMSKNSGELDEDFDRIHLINRGGWLFLSMAVPSMGKILEKAYEAQAEDLELIEQLQQAGARED